MRSLLSGVTGALVGLLDVVSEIGSTGDKEPAGGGRGEPRGGGTGCWSDAVTGMTAGRMDPMAVDWPGELRGQFDLEWNLTHGPSLEMLTDEEYLWEPVPGCWSIRPAGPGAVA